MMHMGSPLRAGIFAAWVGVSLAGWFPARAGAEELAAAHLQAPSEPAGIDALAEPAISPDGSEISFVCGGDIWTIPAAGGDAHLLVAHAGYASRPIYSPDGHRLAFISNRTGNGDIYVLSFDTGRLSRLTYDDAPDQLDGWSADGRWVYFSTVGHDISNMSDIYRVSAEGGTPMPVVADRFANESEAAAHPDRTTVAFCAGGYSPHWWRKGHSHLDEAEIWLMRRPADGTPTFTRLTDYGARTQWPMWSADGKTLYYVSDRSGTANVWSLTIGGKTRQITNFTDGRVVWPTLSHDGKTLVFEREFGIWKLKVDGGQSTGGPVRVSVRLRGAVDMPDVKHVAMDRETSEFALSPDGKKIAFVVHGQIFAASADGGNVVRVTWTDSIESRVVWAHDSKRLVYVSNRDGPRHLYLYDFGTRKEIRLTIGPGDEGRAEFSHNDQMLAYQRNGSEIHVLDFHAAKDRLVAKGQAFEQWPLDNVRTMTAWSPADDWLAFVSTGAMGFNNIYVVPPQGGAKPRQISFLPNYESNSIVWSPRGSFVLFASGQRTEPYQLARIDLVERVPLFQEDQFRDLFRDQTTRVPSRIVHHTAPPQTRPSTSPSTASSTLAAAKSSWINFDGIDQRVTLMPVGMEVADLALSPDGKAVAFLARSGNRRNVYLYPMESASRENVARQLTSSGGNKWDVQFRSEIVDGRLTSKSVYYLVNGEIHSVALDGQDHAIPIRVEMDIDFHREKLAVFNEAWTFLRDHFHDRNFNGADWKHVHEEYLPLIAGVKSPAEARRLLNLMVGELNSSHLGVGAPEDESITDAGRLGLEFSRDDYERDGVLRVTKAIPLSPAAVAGVETDHYVRSIDDTNIGPHTNLDQLLEHKIGHEVVLGISRSAKGADIQKLRLLPISLREEKTLLYRDWVNSRREFVRRLSNGHLGYIHLADMTEAALARLYTDLNSETYLLDGVIIDVRNNNGGFVNGYASDVFARRNYISITERGFPAASGRVALGQRFLGLPTILLTNRHTLSDGEDFTEAYQAQNLGLTVGETTAGWIIFTDGVHLLDGTPFRIPTSTVRDHNGQVMEMHPRHVDIPIIRPVGESYGGQDIQLKRCVEALSDQIDDARYEAIVNQCLNEALSKHAAAQIRTLNE